MSIFIHPKNSCVLSFPQKEVLGTTPPLLLSIPAFTWSALCFWCHLSLSENFLACKQGCSGLLRNSPLENKWLEGTWRCSFYHPWRLLINNGDYWMQTQVHWAGNAWWSWTWTWSQTFKAQFHPLLLLWSWALFLAPLSHSVPSETENTKGTHLVGARVRPEGVSACVTSPGLPWQRSPDPVA